jgi:hypothetical protein
MIRNRGLPNGLTSKTRTEESWSMVDLIVLSAFDLIAAFFRALSDVLMDFMVGIGAKLARRVAATAITRHASVAKEFVNYTLLPEGRIRYRGACSAQQLMNNGKHAESYKSSLSSRLL